jgi:hypothetical protein
MALSLWDKAVFKVKLTIHFHLAPKTTVSGVVMQLPHTSSWRVA